MERDAPARGILPPPFELTTLRERGDAFAEAIRLAPTHGAGTVVRTGRFDTLEFAVVLEPEEPLAQARVAFPLCMGALASALALHVPPQRPLAIRWPDAFLLDTVIHGGGRLAAPDGAGETEAPGWLVFGARVALERAGGAEVPVAMSLAEAGLDEIDPLRLIADFCAHLLSTFDLRGHEGMQAAGAAYLTRLDIGKAGLDKRLAENGDVLIARPGGVERLSLAAALDPARWLAEMGEAR